MDTKAVSHGTSLGSEEKELQSSPKILETPMHVPFCLQCWDVIAKLRGYNNITKWRGKRKGSRIFQSASRFLSKIVWSGAQFLEHAQEMPNKTLTFLVATRRPCICNVSCNDDVHVCWSSINFVNFFFRNVRGEGEMSKEKSCVQKKFSLEREWVHSSRICSCELLCRIGTA